MGHKKDENTQEESYNYIKETIKREPVDKTRIARKIATIIGSSVLFGCCASAACAGMFPVFVEQFGIGVVERDNLRIITPSPEDTGIHATGRKVASIEAEAQDVISPLENYEAIYGEVLKVSEQPRRALVNIAAISGDQDLLDDSRLSYNCAQGVIFLETDEELYIVACGVDPGEASNVELTFCDGTTAVGTMCRKDTTTGILVAKVEKVKLSEETRKALYVVDLGTSTEVPGLSPVIAIGSPSGDNDAVVYGMITSVSELYQVPDFEYNILATDMHGSPEGSGVFLDTSGNVIGIIMRQDPNSTGTVRAFSVSQIRHLIEGMSNKKKFCYTGIYGTSITQAQSDRLHIPRGVYVDRVADNSPAMAVGIQSGDILMSLNGVKINDMQAYNKQLQKIGMGNEALISISRNSAEGKYVEMDFKVRIDER